MRKSTTIKMDTPPQKSHMHSSSKGVQAKETVPKMKEDLKKIDPLATQTGVALTPFHLALPAQNLHTIHHFYIDQLGGHVGRQTQHWLDLSLFGHQLSFHLYPQSHPFKEYAQGVSGDSIPVPHFGVVLTSEVWHAFASRLIHKEIPFFLEPRIRFRNTAGEQGTFFLRDPQGYLLEFKFFAELSSLFAHDLQNDSYE